MPDELFGFDLGEQSLDDLGSLNDRYKQKAQSETKAAKGAGGVGTNKFDDAARDASRKQIKVENEIFGRLSSQHESRSERAQRVDENRKAPIADSPDQWSDHPDEYDWPGIDTPL